MLHTLNEQYVRRRIMSKRIIVIATGVLAFVAVAAGPALAHAAGLSAGHESVGALWNGLPYRPW